MHLVSLSGVTGPAYFWVVFKVRGGDWRWWQPPSPLVSQAGSSAGSVPGSALSSWHLESLHHVGLTGLTGNECTSLVRKLRIPSCFSCPCTGSQARLCGALCPIRLSGSRILWSPAVVPGRGWPQWPRGHVLLLEQKSLRDPSGRESLAPSRNLMNAS